MSLFRTHATTGYVLRVTTICGPRTFHRCTLHRRVCILITFVYIYTWFFIKLYYFLRFRNSNVMQPLNNFTFLYSRPVDVWALGVLLYFMVAGYMPFRAPTVPGLRASVLNGNYTMPTHLTFLCSRLIGEFE